MATAEGAKGASHWVPWRPAVAAELDWFESEELESHGFIFSHSPYFWLQILGCLLPTPQICDKE